MKLKLFLIGFLKNKLSITDFYLGRHFSSNLKGEFITEMMKGDKI